MSKIRRCKQCGFEHPENWTWITRPKMSRTRTTQVCKGCIRSKKDEYKRKNRAKTKAQNAIKTHAKRFIDREIIDSRQELVDVYGWIDTRMAHELEHHLANGCQSCGDSYKNMGNGYGDITLDVIDPNQKPFYGSNTRWICSSCNKSKGRMSLEEFAFDQHWWKKWQEYKEAGKDDPYHGLPLFEGQFASGQMEMGFEQEINTGKKLVRGDYYGTKNNDSRGKRYPEFQRPGKGARLFPPADHRGR